jgi:hypothetical protein
VHSPIKIRAAKAAHLPDNPENPETPDTPDSTVFHPMVSFRHPDIWIAAPLFQKFLIFLLFPLAFMDKSGYYIKRKLALNASEC